MSGKTVGTAVLAAAAALCAPGLAAENRGVPMNSGDSFTGNISPAGDSDAYVMDLSEGGTLTAKVRRGDKTSALLPAIEVLRPDGSALSTTGFTKGEGTSTLSLKKLPLDATGTWAVVVSGASGTTGSYAITLSTKPPTKQALKGSLFPDSIPQDLEFTGTGGALLTFKVTVKSGPGFSEVLVLDPEGVEVPGSAAAIVASGTKTSAANVSLGQGFGRYALRLTGAAGGVTTADVSITVRLPKVVKRKVILGDEPRITSLSPDRGVDGTSVGFLGTGFATGADVWFGDTQASAVSVTSTTAATVAAPGGFDDTQNIQVEVTMQNPDGQVATLASGFLYLAKPTLASVSPALSPLAGGVTLDLTGTSFRSGATVTVGDTSATNVVVTNSTLLHCTTPAHAAGATDVVVTDEYGRPTDPISGHSYVGPPTASSLSPARSPLAGGVTLTVGGSGFRTGATVSVGGTAATSVSVGSAISLTCTSPAHAVGAVNVVVSDEFGQTSGNVSGHAYVAAPTASQASPQFLPLAGGSVTLTGTAFLTGSTRVFLGVSEMSPIVVTNATSLSFPAPAGSEGAVTVKVQDEFGQNTTNASILSYVAAPTVSSASPAQVSTLAGQTVTLTGTRFRSSATRVFLNSVEVTPVNVASATSLSFIWPGGSVGDVPILVKDEWDQQNSYTGMLACITLSVTSVTPAVGPGSGGTLVLVQGIGFGTTPKVRFGANEAYAVNRLDATSILCRTPAASAVSATASTQVNVVVENSPGTDSTLTNGFAYDPDAAQPTVTATVPAEASTGVARNLQKFVFVLSEPVASGTVVTGNFDFFKSPSNDINSPRVSAAATAGAGNVIVLTRGTASGGNLSSTGNYLVNISGVTDVAGNALNPTPFSGTVYQATFSTGAGTDAAAPTVSSTSPASGASSADVDGAVTVTFSEAVDPSTVAGAFSLKQSSTVIDGVLTLDSACTTLTCTPRSKLTANTAYTIGVATTLKDLCGNALASTFSVTFTTASTDGTAPTQALTVDALPQDINGSGNYATGTSNGGSPSMGSTQAAFDAYLPRAGLTIDVSFADSGGSGIDPSTFGCTCSAAMGSIGAGQALAGQFAVTQFGATWTVDSGHALAAGSNISFSVDVKDRAGNSATQQTLVVDVADITKTITNTAGSATTDRDPFNSRQSWLLRFDEDIYTITSAAGVTGSHTKPITVSSTLASNSIKDFKEDLTLVGLNGTEVGGAATVTNGSDTGTNAIVQTMVKNAVRGYMNMRYGIGYDGTRTADSPDVEFLLEGETKSGGGTVTFSGWTSGSGYSMMTFTGDEQANASGGVIGRANFDLRNTAQDSDSNTGNTLGSNLGTFATHMIRVRINDPDSTNFPLTFDPLISVNTRGGTPVGSDASDATVLAGNFVYSSGTGAQKARYDRIATAVDRLARYLSAVGAHECGHSVGLVADGAPPTGIFGNAHPNSAFVASSTYTTSGHLDTAGPNTMAAAVSFDEAIAGGSDFMPFEPLSGAYLLRRMIYDQ